VRGAALFLLARSSRNWIRGLGRQLQSPRYAVAILIGVAYLGLILFGRHHTEGDSVPPDAVALGGTVFLAVLVAKWWLFGADRLALAFSPAEVQFLFPAPVSRLELLGFKLLRAQRPILLNVLVWTFLLRRGAGAGLGTLPYAVSMWVFFSTIFLHRLGVALVRDSVTQHGRSGLRRAWPALVVIAVVGAAVWSTLQRIPARTLPSDFAGPLDALRLVLDTPPLGWLLWPFRIPLLPLEATDLADWLPRLFAAALLLGLHLFWVLRADLAFEEAAVEASARRALLLDRWKRQGTAAGRPVHRSRRWLPLPAAGHPVSAIVWKNVTRLIRTVSSGFIITLLILVSVAVLLAVLDRGENSAILGMIGSIALGWAAALAVLGPQWVRIDLRGELDRLPMLRTWPLSGATIVAGHVAASALVLTLLELALGGSGLVAVVLGGQATPPGLQLAVFVVVGMLVLAGLNLISLSIQNGAALLYPSWVRTEIRPGGIEQVGQQLLTSGVSLLLLAVAALGPGLLATGVAYLLWANWGSWALVPGGLLAAAGLGLEVFLLIDWIGSQFERADPTTN
jgi:Putative ABC exporter